MTNRFGHCSTGTDSSAFDIDIAKNDRPPKSTASNLVATEEAASALAGRAVAGDDQHQAFARLVMQHLITGALSSEATDGPTSGLMAYRKPKERRSSYFIRPASAALAAFFALVGYWLSRI